MEFETLSPILQEYQWPFWALGLPTLKTELGTLKENIANSLFQRKKTKTCDSDTLAGI